MAAIQVHVLRTRLLHLTVDRPRHECHGGPGPFLSSYLSMKASSCYCARMPPSPRTASVIKKEGLMPGSYKAVGWNWMNSIFSILPLAR